jgi:hypothetical protein
LTNRFAPLASALLLFVILTLTATPAYAMRPFTYHYAFITVTVTDYKFTDPKHAILYGSIRNDGWFTVRLLSGDGTVNANDIDLATGDLIGLPVDVAPGASVSAQATLLGYYTLADLKQMKIDGVHVHAEGRYCFPTWLGCMGPFTQNYDRSFTMQELVALARQYQVQP